MDYFKIKYLRKDIANMTYAIDYLTQLLKPTFIFGVRIWVERVHGYAKEHCTKSPDLFQNHRMPLLWAKFLNFL